MQPNGSTRARAPHNSLRETGQALVEMAFTVIILVLILSAVVDIGRAFFTYLALHNAAAEGAYYASAFPLRTDSNAYPDPDNIVYRTRNEVPGQLQQLIRWNAATITVSYSSSQTPPAVGSAVTVTVVSPFQLIGPLPGLLGWNTTVISLRATATQTILTNQDS